MYQKFCKTGILGVVAVILTFVGCAATQQQIVSKGKVTQTSELNLDNALIDLTAQIVNSMTEGEKKKVAVIEFSDLEGRVTGFGKYLAEELITRLFVTRKFQVIERQLLNKVLKEQKLTLTEIIDPGSAKKIGRLLGVDAIVSGTITDLGTSLRVNARIISTETGTVFAVAATEIVKDATAKKLMGRIAIAQKPKEKASEKPEEAVSGTGKIFFKEDFSEVEEGMIPEGWLGCEHLMVKTTSRGQKYLAPFERGPRKIMMQNVEFSSNFRLDIIGKFRDRYVPHMEICIGNLKTSVGYYGTFLGLVGGQRAKGKGKVEFLKISIVKQGPIFKLYVDDAISVTARYPKFTPSSSFIIESNEDPFELYQIIGTDLKE